MKEKLILIFSLIFDFNLLPDVPVKKTTSAEAGDDWKNPNNNNHPAVQVADEQKAMHDKIWRRGFADDRETRQHFDGEFHGGDGDRIRPLPSKRPQFVLYSLID